MVDVTLQLEIRGKSDFRTNNNIIWREKLRATSPFPLSGKGHWIKLSQLPGHDKLS